MTRFRLYGAAAAYFACEDREVLCESGARTGKTHSELVKAKFVAETYPGSRQLFARETRKSLTETVLPDWEMKVLGHGHHAIGKARRNNRDAYHFSNGSVVVLHGLDDPENLLSGEFDRFYVFQAEQLQQQDTWDSLLSRLSGSATPYCQATADANPSHERHWLIRRVKETLCFACANVVNPPTSLSCDRCGSTALGRMRHFQYRHQDNPMWFDHELGEWTERGVEYLTQILGRLRGVRRKRLLQHLWVSEEGQILEDWDPEVHRLSGKLEFEPTGWWLTIASPGWSRGSADPMREARIHIDWFGAGADWGFSPHPGALQVWAYDRHGRRFMVVEVCKTGQQVAWWAEAGAALWKEFDLRYIAVDPSANDLCSAFNTRIGEHGGPSIAIGANNVLRRQSPDLAGIDLMRWGLRDPKGTVRTFILKDALRYGVDQSLRDAGRPTCLEEEIPEWVFEKKKSTGNPTEKPDPECADHCLDAWRYEQGEGWGIRMSHELEKQPYPEGSAGAIHRTAEKMERARRWLYED